MTRRADMTGLDIVADFQRLGLERLRMQYIIMKNYLKV
jgi:hypothetical protein